MRPFSLDSLSTNLIELHDAKKVEKLAKAIFTLIDTNLSSVEIILFLRPLEFELPALNLKPRFRKLIAKYVESDHKFDLWLKRSPAHPRVTVVRHSNYTPRRDLMRSEFYRRTLRPLGAEYGASLVAWRSDTWLATVTVLRGAEQGDFGPQQMAFLRMLQPHFALAVKRLAGQEEIQLVRKALDHYADGAQKGVVVLNWSLDVLYYNRAARDTMRQWSSDVGRGPASRNGIRLGRDLRAEIQRWLPLLESAKPNRPSQPRHLKLQAFLRHRDQEHLMATITFIPSKTLSYSKGSFLLVLSSWKERAATAGVRFDLLTPREAQCVKLLGAGLSNAAIARELKVSPLTIRNQLSAALHKLGMKSRYEAAAAVIQAARENLGGQAG